MRDKHDGLGPRLAGAGRGQPVVALVGHGVGFAVDGGDRLGQKLRGQRHLGRRNARSGIVDLRYDAAGVRTVRMPLLLRRVAAPARDPQPDTACAPLSQHRGILYVAMLVPVIALLLVIVMPCVHLASIALDTALLCSRSPREGAYRGLAQVEQ